MSGISPFSSSLWTPPGLPPPSRPPTVPVNSENSLAALSNGWSGEGRGTNSETPVEGVKAMGGGFKRWNGGGGMLGFTPLPLGDQEERRPLGNVNANVGSALASAYTLPNTNSVWGPPLPMAHVPQRQTSLEEQLAAAEKKIRDLTLENEQLKMYAPPVRSPSGLFSPATSTHSSMYFDTPLPSGFAEYGYRRYREDDDAASQPARSVSGETSNGSLNYMPPPHLIAAVIHGSFNFIDMPPEYMRPIVWVVAHCQPRSNTESAGLKTAVNSLANRLSYPRDSEMSIILINAIIEWAKDLCYTSCGNYLCQQLLERGEVEDKLRFIETIKDDLVDIASDKFGTHVLCKAVAVKELEGPISVALLKHGIFESMRTGARRLWREYLERSRQAQNFDIFEKINSEMTGRWSELACHNEHGSIAVQQVFEVYGSPELMEPCFQEILADISRVANNQFGHFVITKLTGYPPLYRATCDAILTAYPPVATTHHGVNFSKLALQEGGRASVAKYVEALCNHEGGKTPGIVAIATSSIGKQHLGFLLSCLSPNEQVRVRQVCRAYSTTLRNSQSGNDLLRSLGLIHAVGSRHRSP